MEQCPSCETKHSAVDQAFPHVLWNPEVNMHVPYRPTVLLNTRQINPLHSTVLFIQDIFEVTFPFPSYLDFPKISLCASLRRTCGPRGTPNLTKLCILNVGDILNCIYCSITENFCLFFDWLWYNQTLLFRVFTKQHNLTSARQAVYI